jgi:hypothetical protein
VVKTITIRPDIQNSKDQGTENSNLTSSFCQYETWPLFSLKSNNYKCRKKKCSGKCLDQKKKKKGEGSDLFGIFHNKQYCGSYRSSDVVKTMKCDLNVLYMQVEWWGACMQNFGEKASFEVST